MAGGKPDVYVGMMMALGSDVNFDRDKAGIRTNR